MNPLGIFPAVFGAASRRIMAAAQAALALALEAARHFTPYLKDRNFVAMSLAQLAIAFGLPAADLDVWTTRVVLLASLLSALLFIVDQRKPEKPVSLGMGPGAALEHAQTLLAPAPDRVAELEAKIEALTARLATPAPRGGGRTFD